MSGPQPGDVMYMGLAVELARSGVGEVEPNPPVGAIVVKDGAIVGQGYHPHYGSPHAEVVALAEAGERARGGLLFVTLEPCCTSGKTPPCTDAIVRAGIERVVYGCIDPNTRHVGRGLEILRSRGVHVSGPVGEDLAAPLLVRFRRHLDSDRPFVILKWAMTLDGKTSTRTGDSRWISGTASRALVHDVRAHVDGILVGRGTVESDHPRLTARPAGVLSAARIVLDRELRLPTTWEALSDGGPRITIVHGPRATADRVAALADLGVDLVCVHTTGTTDFLKEGLSALRGRGINRLLVEAGPRLLGSFVDARCIDQVLAFVAPKVFGGETAPGAVGGLGINRVAEGLQFEEGRWDLAGPDAVFRAFVRQEP